MWNDTPERFSMKEDGALLFFAKTKAVLSLAAEGATLGVPLALSFTVKLSLLIEKSTVVEA